MTVSIIAKNASQGAQKVLRGGTVSGIGTAIGVELTMFQGGLLFYDVPSFVTAHIKGAFTITDLGANDFLQIELFDTRAGRIIAQGRSTTVNTTVQFDFTMVQLREEAFQDYDIQCHGNNVANDGKLEWSAEITELPN